MDTNLQFLDEVQKILEKSGYKGSISLIEQLEGNFTVFRCSLDEQNIIIKKVPLDKVDNSHNSTEIRFRNEIAGLTFVNTGLLSNLSPDLIAYDLVKGIIITRDLGKMESVMDILNGKNKEKALQAIKAQYKTLALLHREGFAHKQKLESRQQRLSAKSPLSDSTLDGRAKYQEDNGILTHFGWDNGDTNLFFKKFHEIEKELFENTKYHTTIHCDSGPQNFIYGGENAILMDYEFIAIGNFAMDIVGHRFSFPQSGQGKVVPKKYFDEIEDSYFETLSSGNESPVSRDEFDKLLVYSSIHWLFNRYLSGWETIYQPSIKDPGYLVKKGNTKANIERFTSKLLYTIQSLGKILEEEGDFVIFQLFLQDFESLIHRLFDPIHEAAVFPAFVTRSWDLYAE